MEDPAQWGVWARQDDQWQFQAYPGTTRSVRVIPRQGASITRVSVAAIDRTGNANFSKPVRTGGRTTR
jgi:hypothetical protein